MGLGPTDPAGFNPQAFGPAEGNQINIAGLIHGLNSAEPEKAVQAFVNLHNQYQEQQAATGGEYGKVQSGKCGCGASVSACGCAGLGALTVTNQQTNQPLSLQQATQNGETDRYVDGAVVGIGQFGADVQQIWDQAGLR